MPTLVAVAPHGPRGEARRGAAARRPSDARPTPGRRSRAAAPPAGPRTAPGRGSTIARPGPAERAWEDAGGGIQRAGTAVPEGAVTRRERRNAWPIRSPPRNWSPR
ncbi:hypothetical protein GCM10010421_59720 [Streptomyces glaucus]|uniref:Secreted protein n=1 Tax=Streptomyces glaucus TaxID=284029 RepID=A0ABN3KJ86_9ACTN